MKHDRKVALKVLRPELAAVIGAERFLQEIKVTANLQHPHILPLHDSGDADNFLYYVMPYIEGDTLRDKLDREKQLAIEDAVEITRSIASALDYAHRQGVIHRDIKPENILLHDGQATVADFGIALAVSQASGQRLTETGLSMGTPHYMSPEQAMGDRELDARSDIYSLGAMLYEMLAGEPPYQGSSAQAIVAKVITEKAPQVTATRDTVPMHVNAAIIKALNKMPADRFATAAAFADALTNVGFTIPSTVATPVAEPHAAPHKARFVWPAVAGVMALVTAWALLRSSPTPEQPVIRYELSVPELEAGLVTNFGSNIAISPNGRRLVYTGASEAGPQLWLRERNRLAALPVAGGEDAHQPFFSPDGNRVAFISGNRALRIVSLSGEPLVTLIDSGIVRGGGTWGDDGYLYFVAGTGGQSVVAGISRMLATGGPLEVVTTIDTAAGEAGHTFPQALPDGRGIVFIAQTELYNADASEIAVLDLQSGDQRRLLQGSYVQWSSTGHLIVVRADGSLVAAPFDLASLEVTGPTMPLLEGVSVEGLGTSDIALSASGTLMYQAGNVEEDPEQIVWMTRDGTALPVDTGWMGNFGPGALSPDGTKLALEVVENGTHIWIKQLDTGPTTKMTFEGNINARPTWTPDGREILFLSNRGENFDLYRRRADGSTAAELLLDHERPIRSAFYSSNGEWLIYRLSEGPTGADIYARRVGDSTEIAVVAGQFDEVAPTLSPDGKWLAYVSNESGTREVYVRPFPS
ncbi:MAG: protein kinase, partial [Gemmatimonadales bacterium]